MKVKSTIYLNGCACNKTVNTDPSIMYCKNTDTYWCFDHAFEEWQKRAGQDFNNQIPESKL